MILSRGVNILGTKGFVFTRAEQKRFLYLDNTFTQGILYYFNPAVQIKLGHEPGFVSIDSFRAYYQHLRDFFSM